MERRRADLNSVTVGRTLDASPEAVREAMDDVGPFLEASGFDEVRVDGDTLRVAKGLGPATVELTLVVRDDPDSDLAYEQTEGIFEAMWTAHTVTDAPEGSEVTATTDFSLDVALVGGLLDATVVERRRRRELAAQLDWLAETAGE